MVLTTVRQQNDVGKLRRRKDLPLNNATQKYVSLLLAFSLVVTASGSATPSGRSALPIRFSAEPPPFAYVTDKTVTVVPCSSELSNAETRWLSEEPESNNGRLQLTPIPGPCPNNKSLVVVGSKYKKSPCGMRLREDAERWSTKQVTCSLAAGGHVLLSRPVLLIRVAEIGKPTVRVASQQVFENGVIHLRCQLAYDRPNLLHYSWSVDGNPLRTSSLGNRVNVLSYGDLYIRNATEADTLRRYNCAVWNAHTGQNLTSDEAPRPSYAVSSSTQFAPVRYGDVAEGTLTVSVGAVAEFTCPLHSYPSPRFNWISDTNLPVDRTEKLGGLMIIRNVQPTDAGEYRCEAVNSAANEPVSFKWTLRVKKPLKVAITPVYSEVAAGDNVELRCNADAQDQAIDIPTWYHNGKQIYSNSEDAVADGNGVLRLSNVSRTARGIYQCVVTRREYVAASSNLDISGEPFYSAAASAFVNLTKESAEILYITADQLSVPKDSQYGRSPERQLECRAAGVPLPSVSWYLDDEPLVSRIRSATVDEYTIVSYLNVSVRNDTSGRYTCEAANSAGKVTRTSLLFAAQASGMRPLRVANATVFVNANLTIGCFSLWSPQRSGVTISWKRVVQQGNVLSNIVEDRSVSIDSSLSGSSRLVFTHIQLTHAGLYQCDVVDSGSKQTLTQRQMINVRPQPSLTITPVPNQPTRGGALTLNCVVSNANQRSIRWYKDGRLLAANRSDVPDLQYTCAAQLGSCIVIKKLDFVHNGNYTCEMDSQYFSEMSQPYQLSVHYAPQFDDNLPHGSNIIEARVLEGSDVVLDCKASGNPKVSVRWETSNNGRDLKNPQPIDADDQRLIIHANDSLQIREAAATHSNLYRCTVSNNAPDSSNIHRIFNVSIFVPVRVDVSEFNSETVDVYVSVNQPAELRCRILGDLPVNITWYHERKPISVSANRKKYNVTISNDSAATVSTLQIAKMIRSDGGLYTCNATNRFLSMPLPSAANGRAPSSQTVYNHATLNFSVRVLEPPSRIEEITLVNVTNTSAELIWRTPNDGHSPIAFYLIEIGNSTSSGTSEKWLIAGAHDYKQVRQICIFTGDHEAACDEYGERYADRAEERIRRLSPTQYVMVIDRLEPAFTYTVNISARNAEGVSPFSSREFTTAEAPPDAAPLIKHVIAQNDTSLFIAWNPPPVLNQRGELAGYHIQYERCGMAEKYPLVNVPVPAKSATYDPRIGLVTFVLSPLRRFTRYCVRVNAYNGRGSGPFSATDEQLTAESVPTESPKSVQCSMITSNGIRISWQPPPLPAMNGILHAYSVVVKEPLADENEENAAMYQTSKTEVQVGPLEPATNYSITVQARTRVGDGVASEPVFCRTAESAPTRPQNVRAVQVTQGAALLLWQPAVRANGALTEYAVRVSAPSAGEEIIVSDGCKHSVPEASFFSRSANCVNNCGQLICGLQLGRTYEFSVKGATLAGYSEESKWQLQMTAPKPATLASLSGMLSVAVGDSVMLNCLVIGRSTRTFWTFGGSELALRSGKHQQFENNSLVINNVQQTDRGNYVCNTNDNRVEYDLVVATTGSCRVPEKPHLLTPITTQTSIQLRWSLKSNGNCAIEAFEIRWRAISALQSGKRYARARRQVVDTTSMSNDVVVVRSKERAKQFVALKCGTAYNFSIIANNTMGKSAPGEQSIRTDGANLIRPSPRDVLQPIESTWITVNFGAFLARDSCPLTSVNVTVRNASGFVIFSRELAEAETLRPLNITTQPQTIYTFTIRARSDSDEVELDEILAETLPYRASGVLPVREGELGFAKATLDNWTIIVPVAVCVAFLIVLVILGKVLYGRRTQTKRGESTEAGHTVPGTGVATQRQISSESNQRSLLLNNAEPLAEVTPAASGRRNMQRVSPGSEIRVIDGSKGDRKIPPRPSRDGRPRAATDGRPVQRQPSDDSAGVKKARGLFSRTWQLVVNTLFGNRASEYEDVPIDEANMYSPANRQLEGTVSNVNQSGSSTLEHGAAGSQSPANHSTLEDLPAGRPSRLGAAVYRRSSSYEARNRPLPTNRRERTSSDRSNMSRSHYYSGGEYAVLDDTAVGCSSDAQQTESGIDCNKSMMTESWVYSGGDPNGMSRSINTATSIDGDGNIQPYATFHLTPKRTRGVARTFENSDPYNRLTLPPGRMLHPSNNSAFMRPQPAQQQPAADSAQLIARQRSYNPPAITSRQDAARQQLTMRRIQSQTDAQANVIEMSVVTGSVVQQSAAASNASVGEVSRIVKPIATNAVEKAAAEKASQQPAIGTKQESAFRPVPNRYIARGKSDTADDQVQANEAQKKCDVATSPLEAKSDTIEDYSNSNLTASECAASTLLAHAPHSHHRAPSATTMSSNHDELSQLYDSIKGRAQQYTLREDVEEGTFADGRTHKLTSDDKRTLNEDEPTTTCETESSPGATNGAAQVKLSNADAIVAPLAAGANEANRSGQVGGESGGSCDSGIRNFTQLPPVPNEHRQAACEVLLRRPEAKANAAQPANLSNQQADAMALVATPKRHRKLKPRGAEPCDDIRVANENQPVVLMQNQGRHFRTVTDNVVLCNRMQQPMYRTGCVTCTQLPQTAPILPGGLVPGACVHAHAPLPAPPTHAYHTYYPPHAGTMTYGTHQMQMPLEYYASYTPLPAAAAPHMAMQTGYGMIIAQQTHARSLARRPSEGGSIYYSSTPDDSQMTNVLNCVHSAFTIGRANYGISNPVALMAPSACPTGAESMYDSVADHTSSQEQLDDPNPTQDQPLAITSQKSTKQPAVFELQVPRIHQQVYGSITSRAQQTPAAAAAASATHAMPKYQAAPSTAADDFHDGNRSSPSTATVTAQNFESNELTYESNARRSARSAPNPPSSEHYEDIIDV